MLLTVWMTGRTGAGRSLLPQPTVLKENQAWLEFFGLEYVY